MTFEAPWRQELASFESAVERYVAWRAKGRLEEPLRYALAGKGKRVRPLMCLLTAEALGDQAASTLGLVGALSVELIHTYSLIHDDLPCMDDDDLRRGRPTLHKQFDEPTALLLGDALVSEAFFVLSPSGISRLGESSPEDAQRAWRMMNELGLASGIDGMVEGQALDLYWTGRSGASQGDLDEIHLKKTGALLGASAAIGAAAAGAHPDSIAVCREFGRKIGLAFQIIDDLLDDTDGVGKTRGKDKAAGKNTYASLMDRKSALAAADHLTHSAIAEFEAIANKPDRVVQLARNLLTRKH